MYNLGMTATISKMPDAILLSDGSTRLVSDDARSWAWASTTVSRWADRDAMPDVVWLSDEAEALMSLDGLEVHSRRQPPQQPVRPFLSRA